MYVLLWFYQIISTFFKKRNKTLLLFLWVSSLACLSSWEAGLYDSAMESSQWKITTDVSESGDAVSHFDNSLKQSAIPDQKSPISLEIVLLN